MKKEKFYVWDKLDTESAYPKSFIIQEMKKQGLEEIEVSEVVPEYQTWYFYCKIKKSFGNSHFECGLICKDYEPRNGKSGCCKHYGICYKRGESLKLKSSGKLK